MTKNIQHTDFSHHSEAFLVVGASTANKNGDLMLLQWHLMVCDGSNNPLAKTRVELSE